MAPVASSCLNGSTDASRIDPPDEIREAVVWWCVVGRWCKPRWRDEEATVVEGGSDFSFSQVLTSLRSLTTALMGSVALFGAITVFLASRKAGGGSPNAMWFVGFAIAGAMVVAGYFVGRLILAKRVAAMQPPVSERELGQAYFASKVVGWVMIEGGAMLASTLILLSGNWWVGLEIVVLALVALFLVRARREDLEALRDGARDGVGG